MFVSLFATYCLFVHSYALMGHEFLFINKARNWLLLYVQEQKYSANDRRKDFMIIQNESDLRRSRIEPGWPDLQPNALPIELTGRLYAIFALVRLLFCLITRFDLHYNTFFRVTSPLFALLRLFRVITPFVSRYYAFCFALLRIRVIRVITSFFA
jgi:hypothetical protein